MVMTILAQSPLVAPVVHQLEPLVGTVQPAPETTFTINQVDIPPSLPGANAIQDFDNPVVAALSVNDALRDKQIDSILAPTQHIEKGQFTPFLAQLISQSLDAVETISKNAGTFSATEPAELAREAATATPIPQNAANESFNQINGINAYRNVQAVIIPEITQFEQNLADFAVDVVEELEEYAPTNQSPGFGDSRKSMENLIAVQEMLPSRSNIPNPVEQVISTFTNPQTTQNSQQATSLLV